MTLLAPDLLAHGAGPDPDRTRDFHDQATEAAARHLPPEPVDLSGHSFGGTLALRIALDAPERVRSLTLIEPVLFCATDNLDGARIPDARPDEVPRRFLEFWGEAPFEALPATQQDYIRDRIWIPKACEPALVEDRAQMLPRLAALPVPTLLVRGENSPTIIAEINDALAAAIPGASQALIEGAGHMAPLTPPAATAAARLSHIPLRSGCPCSTRPAGAPKG